MRISDWSSDVCSSDLCGAHLCRLWRGLYRLGAAVAVGDRGREARPLGFDRRRRVPGRRGDHIVRTAGRLKQLPFPVRAELVEALLFLSTSRRKNGPSTSSGRMGYKIKCPYSAPGKVCSTSGASASATTFTPVASGWSLSPSISDLSVPTSSRL